MSTTTVNKTIVALVALGLFVLASGATAAPSLGFPKGKPYYGASQQSGSSRVMRSNAPAFSTETRQSFSYEPAQGEVKAKGGCPQHATVAPAEPKQDVATAPRTTRRSFSYEPADEPQPRARSLRSVAPRRDPWLLQKSDPRRYSR